MTAPVRIAVAAAGMGGALLLAVATHGAVTADRPVPGLYRVTTAIAGAKPRTSEECMSAADIAEAFVIRTFPGTCSTQRDVVGGGRIVLARTCKAGAQIRSGTIAGRYTAASFNLHSVSRAPELPQPLDLRMTGQRIGACRPAE